MAGKGLWYVDPMLGSFGGGELQGQMTLIWILMLPATFLTLNWLHG